MMIVGQFVLILVELVSLPFVFAAAESTQDKSQSFPQAMMPSC
jgi:hypothetical protein